MDENDEREVDRVIAGRFSSFRAGGDWQPDLRRGLAILTERRKARKRQTRLGVLAGAALAASLPILAFPMTTRAFAGRVASACVQETAAVRAFLLGRPSGSSAGNTYVKPGDRGIAPDFTLVDASGRRVTLSDYRGKVVLLNFWATWCSPCDREIPWFVQFQESNARRGFTVLGVSMDEGGWASVGPYIERKGVNYPVMIGNDEVAGLFGGKHFPMPLTLIIDRSGRIAAIHAGSCRKDEYESDINTVINER